jgi:hypothetical protein
VVGALPWAAVSVYIRRRLSIEALDNATQKRLQCYHLASETPQVSYLGIVTADTYLTCAGRCLLLPYAQTRAVHPAAQTCDAAAADARSSQDRFEDCGDKHRAGAGRTGRKDDTQEWCEAGVKYQAPSGRTEQEAQSRSIISLKEDARFWVLLASV